MSAPLEVTPLDVKACLLQVREQLLVAHAAAPPAAAAVSVPQLVAVSKYKPICALMAAYNEGQRSFGENYVQELVHKAAEMPPDVQWHFIGHLQSNKAKVLVEGVPNLALVETVDTAKLATQLDKACATVRPGKPLRVLVQLNTSGEASKSGAKPGAETLELVTHVVKRCPNLELGGLMTIGGRGAGEAAQACFEALVKDRKASCEALPQLGDPSGLELSMGMSGDYEAAIACGSTIIRIGTAIFGDRDAKTMHEAQAREAEADKALADVEAGYGSAEPAEAGPAEYLVALAEADKALAEVEETGSAEAGPAKWTAQELLEWLQSQGGLSADAIQSIESLRLDGKMWLGASEDDWSSEELGLEDADIARLILLQQTHLHHNA